MTEDQAAHIISQLDWLIDCGRVLVRVSEFALFLLAVHITVGLGRD